MLGRVLNLLLIKNTKKYFLQKEGQVSCETWLFGDVCQPNDAVNLSAFRLDHVDHGGMHISVQFCLDPHDHESIVDLCLDDQGPGVVVITTPDLRNGLRVEVAIGENHRLDAGSIQALFEVLHSCKNFGTKDRVAAHDKHLFNSMNTPLYPR